MYILLNKSGQVILQHYKNNLEPRDFHSFSTVPLGRSHYKTVSNYFLWQLTDIVFMTHMGGCQNISSLTQKAWSENNEFYQDVFNALILICGEK